MKGAQMALAADYPFLDIMWTMFIFFAFVIWIWLLIMVLADNFRRTDHSGAAKAGWTLFVIFLPLIGVLVYMIVRPPQAGAAYTGGFAGPDR
jgi:Phospholipase_D-nuclease N-terminal